MISQADHIAQLLFRQRSGRLTEEELIELNDWLEKEAGAISFAQNIHDREFLLQEALSVYQFDEQKIMSRLGEKYLEPDRPVAQVHALRSRWIKYAAAIIISFGLGAYLWNSQKNNQPFITDNQPIPATNDVAPGSTRATLTLSNGKRIELDNHTSEIIKDGKLSISNNSGQLIYKNADVAAMNTMSTPRGGQYQLTLSDGTKVWLNAASSITYPTTFAGKTREVNISGEAFFEVASNKSRPFIVKTRNEEIKVLGTSFNVNSYADELYAKTTLVSGAVKIWPADWMTSATLYRGTILRPGEAYVDGKIITTNIEQDMAWKNGVFYFTNASLPAVLRQLSRWYDVDVRYLGPGTPKKLVGKLSRHLPLSEVIKGLQDMQLNVRLENRTIIVN